MVLSVTETGSFTDAEFDAARAGFANPDWVDVVIHSYRHRYLAVPGDPRYDDIEEALALSPTIGVPTIVLHGADDGVDPAWQSAMPAVARRFSGTYERRVLDGVGHNIAQETPDAFAAAVLDVARLAGQRATRM